MKKGNVTVVVTADDSNMDKAILKAEILKQKIQEIKTLADEFNSCISGLDLKIDVKG